MEGTLRIKVIHVAGTSMIVQGTDGLSRVLTMYGFISGEDMMSFVYLNLITLQLLYNLPEWINSWWGQSKEAPLMTEYWLIKDQGINGNFTKSEGHNIPVTIKQGFFIWSPLNYAGDIEIE